MRTFISTILAFILLLVLALPASAHEPTSGSSNRYPSTPTLMFRLGGAAYPSAIQTAIQAALGTDWSWGRGASHLPAFVFSATGSGAVYYSSQSASPCGSGNTQWLQCASGSGSTAWRIYIRNFKAAPYGSWGWCNIAFAGTCWDVERALLHEAEHITLGVFGHDAQGEANTVMASVTPWYALAGWNTHHIQRCDLAAAQLAYGLGSASGGLADCFDHAAGHGSVGLIPALSASTTSISVCLSQPATLSGSFGVGSDWRYGALAGRTLAGRTVWFDRKPRTSSVWTLNIASATTTASGGSNWTRSFSTGSTTTVAYDFRPHTSSETGLDPGSGPIIAVTWRAGC
jgi:hypothetical protein